MRSKANIDQVQYWSGPEGDNWVAYAEQRDRMLAPFGQELLAAAQLREGERVLDIGCGNGSTTIDAATTISSIDANTGQDAGRAIGIDLSPQMLALGRQRAEHASVSNIEFVVTDAQTADLGRRAYDVALSRFGVMFFDDPGAAFANIGAALRPGGRLAFCCWQKLEDNEWMLVPGLAAAEHVALPNLDDRRTAGGFSMADPAATAAILEESGFLEVAIEPFTTDVLLAGGGTLDETIDYLVESGSGRALFAEAPIDARTAAIAAVRRTLEPLHDGDGVSLGASAWMVTAVRKG